MMESLKISCQLSTRMLQKMEPLMIKAQPSVVRHICTFQILSFIQDSMSRVLIRPYQILSSADCRVYQQPNIRIQLLDILWLHFIQKGRFICNFYQIPPGKSPFYSYQFTPFPENTQHSLPISNRLSSLRQKAIRFSKAGGVYITNNFFHCQLVTFRQYKSLTTLYGLICLPPQTIREEFMKATAGFYLLVGNFPLVGTVFQVLDDKRYKNISQEVGAVLLLALNANFFLLGSSTG